MIAEQRCMKILVGRLGVLQAGPPVLRKQRGQHIFAHKFSLSKLNKSISQLI